MRHEGRMDLRKHHILKDYAELAEDGQVIEASVKISDKYRENYDKINWSKKDDTRPKTRAKRAMSDYEDFPEGMEGRTPNCS